MDSREASGRNELLRRSKEGDQSARAELERNLLEELCLRAQTRLSSLPNQMQEAVLQEALADFRDKLEQIESSPYKRALEILVDIIWNRLLIMAKDGDQIAQTELDRRLREHLLPLIERSLRGYLTDYHDQERKKVLEDLLQDVMITFFDMLPKVTSNPPVVAKVIAWNKIKEWRRKHQRNREIRMPKNRDFAADAITNPTQNIEYTETLNGIMQLVSTLSEFCQKVYGLWLQFLTKGIEPKRGEIWEILHSADPTLNRDKYDVWLKRCRDKMNALRKSNPGLSGLRI